MSEKVTHLAPTVYALRFTEPFLHLPMQLDLGGLTGWPAPASFIGVNLTIGHAPLVPIPPGGMERKNT
ncbi:MAG: hypothetical protein D6681_13810 [Calditrichaeota bacterium]|nr:MAG: hypothetical protein D6681_13810 [Calditrichota bacterium]